MKKTITIALIFSSLLSFSQEKHLKNIQKLTFGGDNAEAYFSPNGKKLTMQVTNKAMNVSCDQIYSLTLSDTPYSTQKLHLVSTGKGRTTCSFFMPDGKHILYASTHSKDANCPPAPKQRSDGKYLWPIYSEFDIYVADLKGNIVRRLTNIDGYDAEAVVSPNGKKIAFTSTRSGDLEIWTMDIDGENLKQITNGLGYDGGAFFSHDSKKLVFRASRPKTEEEIAEYKGLLKENLVAPVNMEIYTCNVDGSNLKQITHLGKANWAPYFLPNDKGIIFSSNHHSKRGYDFHLYTVDTNGNNLEQITYKSEFNAFAMFSNDGKKLVFSSNRMQDAPRETNVFLADWIDTDKTENANTTLVKTHISYLSSDDLQGRLAGSKNELKAAEYIGGIFKENGLSTYLSKSYLHPFEYSFSKNPHTDSIKETVNANNVVGFLDNKSNKTIVIGAHYDHLGFNEHHHSTKPNSTEIHNGADDNASGVAGVLELSRMLSKNKSKEKYNYLFVCFSGEEDGLMGSKAIVEELKKNNSNITAMLNMDMIGRLDSMNNLIVGGIGTSPSFGEIVQNNKPAGFAITLDSSGVGPTDHTSFYLKNIPVLNFFTGTHTDYHKPTDDDNKINYNGETKIVDYIFRIVTDLDAKENLEFTKTKTTTGKTAPKYKVTLGVMPDYKDYGDGLHIEAVIDNRPAQKAGLKEGDIIIKIGDCTIKEVYSYMDCLSKINSGESKKVTFLREAKQQEVIVEF
ncbi:MAG: M20/M25/M40 family metallo-hydrolase [Bacteroidetes bacterium]|nr:M20/M25/M40 family metallo-hydrolase [Bacteroidota bacterium]